MSTGKKIPQRQCVGCREMKNKKEMLRILKIGENEFTVDATGKQNGRGAYLCPNQNCLGAAIASKGLERSFKQAIPGAVYEQLKKELSEIETR